MNKPYTLTGLMILLVLMSCSSDDSAANEKESSEKNLTQIIHQYSNSQSQLTRNISYNAYNNISEIKNSNGQLIEKYSYNSTNQITKNEYSEYENQTLTNKDITSITYNSNGKISKIIETYIHYNSDGSILNQNSTNHTITYGTNTMTRVSDDYANTRVEYSLTDNLIKGIKVFKSNELKSNMTFTYDAEGNCISGSGPIFEGSSDAITDDIELSVQYGSEEKNPIFNIAFDYEILTRTSFFNIRQALINLQGNRYAEEIQWYRYSDDIYKETIVNSFDSSENIISKNLSAFPGYPNVALTTYKWE